MALAAGCQTALDDELPPPAPVATPSPPAGTPAPSTLRYALTEPGAIVPSEATSASGLVVVGALFDPLTRWGPDAQSALRPNAAVSWESDEDTLRWTFRLREGAVFHDGAPVTAGDVKFGWELLVRRDRMGYLLENVVGHTELAAGEADELRGVEAVDDTTLVVELVSPDAEFPLRVGHPSLAPVPRHAWEADPEAFAARPVGNGPFLAAEDRVRGQFLRVTRFEDWRNGPRPPHLSEVVFQMMDPETGYLAFQQGRVQISALPAGALESALGRYGPAAGPLVGHGVLQGPQPALYFLGLDVRRPPFDALDVRRALSLAIDREALATEHLEGNADPATRVVPPPVASAGPSCDACVHDPGAAAALFEEAGIDELTLWLSRGGGHEAVARSLREQLAEVGVRLAFRNEPFGDFLDALRAGEASLYRFGWQLDLPTPGDALGPLLSRGGAHNHGGYAHEEVDRLLGEAAATFEPEVRAALYLQAEQLVLDDLGIVPLLTFRHRLVVDERVAGFRLGPTGLPNLHDVRLVPSS